MRAGKIVYDVMLKDISKDQFFDDLEQVYGRPIHKDEVLGENEGEK